MYCNRCNSYNDDSANYCSNCAAALKNQDKRESDFEHQNQNQYQDSQQYQSQQPYQNAQQYQNYSYNQNYNGYQNGYGQPMQKKSNTISIIATVIAALTGNVLGIIFGILSIVKFNDYERLYNFGNFAEAERIAKKSKKYAIVAIVLSVVALAIIPIAISAFFMIFEKATPIVEDLYGFEQGINILIGML